MKFRFTVFLAVVFILCGFAVASAQVNSAIAQITSSINESFVGGISGDGRFVVFESRANLATENPRNEDGNLEIFLFDYAQRRIFQITDTKNLLVDTSEPPNTSSNVRVAIVNTRPVISNDGRWIAFGSNATCTFPGTETIPPIENAGNPGSFDPNTLSACIVGKGDDATNNLINDGNTEMWFYRIPDVPPADLSLGLEQPFTDLAAGTFVQATNTLPSRPAVGGTKTTTPIIADDNRNPAINDNGAYVAFRSNRDLEPCPGTPSDTCGNSAPNHNNDEIFVAVLTGTNPNFTVSVKQITATPKGSIQAPSINDNPTISGNGLRVAFSSTANRPVVGMTTGSNTDNSEEIFYTDLDAAGNPVEPKVQVTDTTPTSPGGIVNIWSYGKRMSRDGRYIAFDSYAELENAGAIQTSFATYLYDANTPVTDPPTNPFRRIGPRSDADSAATGGDLRRFPTFTDYNGLTPETLVLETRLNITPEGTIPTNQDDGLNPDPTRPAQIYSYPIATGKDGAAIFTRLTKLPPPSLVLAVIQPFTTDSLKRITFNMSRTEPGTGNPDLLAEAFYLLTPVETAQTAAALNFATGASRLPIVQTPVPTPSPTATPTPTPTPTPGPSPSPSPPPQTAPAVQGVSPGMLAIVDITAGFNQPVVAQTAVGSLQRSFPLPIELSGVTMTINGVACGLKTVSRREITFVVPPAVAPRDEPYEVVINNNGVVIKGTIVVVTARPDVFSFNEVPGPGGRARIYNATNRVLTREPFNVTTLRYRGGRRVPTVLRLYMTGIQGAQNGSGGNFQIRVGGTMIGLNNILTNAIQREPGVYSVDFTLPASLDMAGDVPIVVQIVTAGVTYSGRLEDTAPVFRIL